MFEWCAKFVLLQFREPLLTADGHACSLNKSEKSNLTSVSDFRGVLCILINLVIKQNALHLQACSINLG